MDDVRKGQAPPELPRDEFGRRFRELRAGRLQAVQPKLSRPRPK